MGAAQAALIWCPFPDLSEARQAAGTLIKERLAACANIIPQVHSLFAWQGAVEEATETVLLLKTHAHLLEQAIARLAELHSYDTPAIAGWVADRTAPCTLEWMTANLLAEGN